MRFLIFLLPLWLFAEAHLFVLHRINDSRHPYTNTSSKELNKYLKYIKTHHYKAVTLSELIKLQKEGKNLNKIVVFTIDDSFKSFYKNGLPVFIKYKIPFTLFVYGEATTDHWGDFMSWKQVKECAKYGELGVHSWAHPHLAMLSNRQIISDTEKAVHAFKKYIGYVPDMYAYPYGEYNARVKKIINSFFPVIANQNVGAFGKNSPINDIDRIALTGKVDIAKKLKLKILHIKNLTVKKDKNKITEISGYTDKPYVNIYITKLGWKGVRVKNGYFDYKPDFIMKKYRTRVIIRYNYKIISKLFLKEE